VIDALWHEACAPQAARLTCSIEERRLTSILIAEDERVSRRILEASLTRWGYAVEVAQDGEQALEALLREGAPRLAIVDWEMPKLNGPEVCRRARARADGVYCYLLLLTSKGSKDLIEGLEAGADDYISKPFNPGELQARLRTGERILALQAQLLDAQEALREQATHDSLTGLYNRRAIIERLDYELARARGQPGILSLLLLDADHFKRVNDGHGHQVGDDVLREMATRLRGVLRASDALGRYGGEELIAVLPASDVSVAMRVAETMRSAVAANPFATRNGPLAVTVSIGSATWNGRDDADALIKRADEALYRAKSAGRNRVEAAS
jgi:two-component system, cell cycle response regulator